MANKEIAAQLKISEHTVKFHVSSILGKLGASSRGEAVARGVRDGLIMI
jgi:DNA-binding NarL/FixJ family response regulator